MKRYIKTSIDSNWDGKFSPEFIVDHSKKLKYQQAEELADWLNAQQLERAFETQESCMDYMRIYEGGLDGNYRMMSRDKKHKFLVKYGPELKDEYQRLLESYPGVSDVYVELWTNGDFNPSEIASTFSFNGGRCKLLFTGLTQRKWTGDISIDSKIIRKFLDRQFAHMEADR